MYRRYLFATIRIMPDFCILVFVFAVPFVKAVEANQQENVASVKETCVILTDLVGAIKWGIDIIDVFLQSA